MLFDWPNIFFYTRIMITITIRMRNLSALNTPRYLRPDTISIIFNIEFTDCHLCRLGKLVVFKPQGKHIITHKGAKYLA